MDRVPDEPLSGALAGFARLLEGGGSAGEAAGSDLLVVVAHPDDETIAIGGQLARLPGATILHVTDGAPPDGRDARAKGFADAAAYSAARRAELEAAVALAGIGPDALPCLEVPDGSAALHMPAIVRALLARFGETPPRFVLTHPYEGGHPDHDACAFSVAAACRILGQAGRPAPLIVEAPFYHEGPAGAVWGDFAGPGEVHLRPLSPVERDRKERMLACHRSQREILAAFDTRAERFRAAPAYDFAALPNGGALLYKGWSLAFRGERWPDAVRAATEELRLDTPWH